MVKSIIKRVIVGVLVALILMYLKGGLIADVNAQVYTFYSDSGNPFSTCTNCDSLTYNLGYDFSYIPNSTSSFGYLYFNVQLYGINGGIGFIPSINNVRVQVANHWYACYINSSSQISNYEYVDRVTYESSFKCPITLKYGGVINTIQILSTGTNGGGISLYSPITYVEDNSSTISQQIEESTQQQIEAQKACNVIDKSYGELTNTALSDQGEFFTTGANGWVVTKYINIKGATIEKINNQGNVFSSCWYDEDKNLISCFTNGNTPVGAISVPNNAVYIRFSIYSGNNKPTYKVCKNGNQSILDSNNQLNDTLNDNNISSGTNESLGGILSFGTQQETFGPVADLLLLPLTLFGAYYSGFGATCSSFTLGTLYGHSLTLPCINLQSILGSSLFNLIDIAISLFMILNIALMCIDIFDRLTSFEDPFNELYTPKHTYHSRHGGGK